MKHRQVRKHPNHPSRQSTPLNKTEHRQLNVHTSARARAIVVLALYSCGQEEPLEHLVANRGLFETAGPLCGCFCIYLLNCYPP